MEDEEIGQSDVLHSGSSSTDDDGDSKWEAYDAAFRGKTATAVKAMADAATSMVGRSSNTPPPPPSSPPLGVSRNDNDDDDEFKDGEERPESGTLGVTGEEEEEAGRPFLPRGGRGLLQFASNATPHRWVDFCSGSSSSSSSRSIGSSATSSSTEDMRLLVPGRRRAGTHERNSPSSAFAPGYDGGGGSVAAADQKVHRHHQFTGANRHLSNSDGKRNRPHLEVTTAHARRSPLPLYANATPTAITRAQQQQHQHQNSEPSHHYYQHTGASSTTTTSRLFAWFVLLHGCLCEAPLAVIEGLVRGPLYLVAAAWIAIVGFVGASRHVEHRAELYKHAVALAREGVLLLVASLTLAMPLSTSFTVYGEVVDRAEDDAWDARPIPTVLGAVDPLRFFVFAFGQAGELAANGRPEPLHQQQQPQQQQQQQPDPFHHQPSSRRAFTPSSSPSLPFGKLAAGSSGGGGGGGGGPAGSSGDFAAAEGGRSDNNCSSNDNNNNMWNNDKNDASSLLFSSSPRPVSYVGVVAAQSMDTDRLGVGMLHPPQEIGLRFRRGGASARRAAVSAYRRLATSAATAYRRFLLASS